MSEYDRDVVERFKRLMVARGVPLHNDMNPEDIRQLAQGRIAQAVESLADATTLLATGRSGRSVVNRSYYAMFYKAVEQRSSESLLHERPGDS